MLKALKRMGILVVLLLAAIAVAQASIAFGVDQDYSDTIVSTDQPEPVEIPASLFSALH